MKEEKPARIFSFCEGDLVKFGPWATTILREDFDRRRHRVISVQNVPDLNHAGNYQQWIVLENGRTYSGKFFEPATT